PSLLHPSSLGYLLGSLPSLVSVLCLPSSPDSSRLTGVRLRCAGAVSSRCRTSSCPVLAGDSKCPMARRTCEPGSACQPSRQARWIRGHEQCSSSFQELEVGGLARPLKDLAQHLQETLSVSSGHAW